ncbi:MAG: RDD family protein [Candidatus Acidiferrales bacterium]
MPFCSKCGANVADGSGFCSSCGQPLPAGAAPTPAGAPLPPPEIMGCAVLEPRYQPLRPRTAPYAGFWLRLVAWFIDAIVLGVAGNILLLPFGGWMGFNLHRIMMGQPPRPEDFFPLAGFALRAFIIKNILHWIYYALLESSNWQATVGKKALGLEVTDLAGARISFGRATGRFVGRYLSVMTLGIGFLMIGFTEKKQALHDLLAGTLVIRKV